MNLKPNILTLVAFLRRALFAAPLLLFAALLSLPLATVAAEQSVTFRGQTIKYEGAELKWIGEETAADAELLLIFKNDGSFTPSAAVETRVLAVGGGGAGGTVTSSRSSYRKHPGGGGGGAGEFVDRESVAFAAERAVIVVGAGGTADGVSGTASIGRSGHDSSIQVSGIDVIRVKGGGGGGGESVGQSGGSGGGGSNDGAAGGAAQKNESDGLANAGGSSQLRYAGGGGGATEAGEAALSTRGGNGGAGKETDIDPYDIKYYAGGGGGGCTDTGKPGTGSAGGGTGGRDENDDASAPTAGEANTGSGGGGGGRYKPGAAGGSGIVIIRITYIEIPMVWKAIEISGGGNTGKIFVDENASWSRVDPSDKSSDIIIAYSNVNVRGGLRFFDPDDASLPPVWANARVLAVGGGGGGGLIDVRSVGGGAGGGAGGFVEKSGLVFDNTVEFSISVGRGGAAGESNETAGESGLSSALKTNGVNVVDEALGGGGGGAHCAGADGASGGGGSRAATPDAEGVYDRAGGSGTSGQGYAGGAGCATFSAGGGGGAGGVGTSASNEGGGAGGIGKTSDITGELLWYAGGGGGAFVNGNDTSSLKHPGGAGGSDVGGQGAGNATDGTTTLDAVAATDGLDGRGGGGGGGTSHAGATSPAGKGGNGVVIIRLSGFVVKNIPLPTPQGPFVYDGNAHTGLVEFFAYTLSGTPIATNSDVYTVTATIPTGKPYTWADAAETGQKWGPRTVTWRITQKVVTVPEALGPFTFGNAARSGTETFTAVKAVDAAKANGGVDANGDCWTNGLKYCSLSKDSGSFESPGFDGYQGVHANYDDHPNYTFKATLVNDYESVPNVTNFIWKSEGEGSYDSSSTLPQRLRPVFVDWYISQAENAITKLTLANWQSGTTVPTPTTAWQWSNVAKTYGSDHILYQYGDTSVGPWEPNAPVEFSEIAETLKSDPGRYYLRATICEDSVHHDWCAAEKKTRFCVWQHPTTNLSDYVDITIDGYAGGSTAVSDFPVLVRLKEAVRGTTGAITGGIPGFRYADVRDSGAGLRFLSVSSTGDTTKDVLLPFEIDTWNPSGESLVWVKVPQIVNKTTKIRMYWRVKEGEELFNDFLACDTWDEDYLAVWHMNTTDSHGRAVDSTANENNLEGSPVRDTSAKTGYGFKASKTLYVAKTMSELGLDDNIFTFSGWYKATDYTTGQTNFFGNKTGKVWNWAPGWSAFMNNSTAKIGASANGTHSGDFTNTDLTKNWHRLDYVSPGQGTRYFHYDYNGQTKKTFNNSGTVTNDFDLTVAVQGFAADEVRLSKTKRSDQWLQAEYQTVTVEKYCTFGLVNQLQADGTRAWVDYWTTEPTVKRYCEINELKTSDITSGKLASGGLITNVYARMPHGEKVDFDYMKTHAAPYTANFSLFANPVLSGTYSGLHTYYDGDRTLELEIIESKPRPIDPEGAGVDAVNRRVLLANDDLVQGGDTVITNQGYWAWTHEGTYVPGKEVTPSEFYTNNLLPGIHHELRATNGVDVLWVAENVYMGNILATNEDAVTFHNTQRSIPWSATSLNSTPNAEDEAKAFNHTKGGTFVMRNVAADTNAYAYVESPWYTNGIGTVYFDAVSADALSDAAAFSMVVEISTNATDATRTTAGRKNWIWTRVESLTPLHFLGSAFSQKAVTNEVDVSAVGTGATHLDRFVRVCAKIDSHTPMRFRIRRTGEFAGTAGEDADPDDICGFIVVDNIVASWPKADAELVPSGWYDAAKSGKQVLGQETSMTVDYPTANETDLRIRARLRDPASAEYVTSARCYYRWRYLDAVFVPERIQTGTSEYKDMWSTIYIDVTNNMAAMKPFELDGRAGDLEYYFEASAVVPYYQFVDYTGKAATLTTKYYTEDVSDHSLSCRRSNTDTSKLPSRGTDWFVRLREAKSDLTAFKLYVKYATDDGEKMESPSDFVLASDNVWRGFYRTLTPPKNGEILYRIESYKPVTPGASYANYATNYWKGASDFVKTGITAPIPGSTILEAGDTNKWSRAHCDAATGHLMFQIDDSSLSLTVTHADYQDFNGWNDAVSEDDPPYFTGSSIEANAKRGVSSKMIRQTQDFSAWTDTPETKVDWQEYLEGVYVDDSAHPGYTLLSQAKTPNGWTVENGQWVGKFYHPVDFTSRTNCGAAVQLSCSGGRLQVLSPSGNPRGIGTVTVSARVAQPIGFYDFSYFDGGRTSKMTNYTFRAHATFDRNQNKNFAGSATLSLVAFYRSTYGCYEARWEQLKDNGDAKTALSGPNLKSQRLSLYRWTPNTQGAMTAVCLGSITNAAFKIPQSTAKASSQFLPFYISCSKLSSGNTEISVGVLRADNGKTLTESISGNWMSLHYIDSSAGHPTSGSYGVLSANCEGVFAYPVVFAGKATVSGAGSAWDTIERLDNKAVSFPSGMDECREGLAEGDWAVKESRMTTFDSSSTEYGLKAIVPSVNLGLYLADRGTTDFTLFGSRTVSTFGSPSKAGETYTFTVRDLTDRALRLAPLADEASDVVITGVAFTQWRGDNFGEGDTTGYSGYNDGYGYKSNFVFTSGIIQDNKVLLSARRTKPTVACSVRSPHYDGQQNRDGTTRGLGLGMISFNYANAQANARVLVQVATNSEAAVGRDITTLTTAVSNGWTTVATYDFADESALDRRSGVKTVHLGLRGIPGLMRVVLDPEKVSALQNETDPTKFGEIEITRVVCRDEPKLTTADWWGWNLRTVDLLDNSVSDYLRTYLPDGDVAHADAVGLSLALNNSITEDVRENDKDDIRVHMPFLQTPTFTNNIVGEVTFRARRYDNGDDAQYAEIQLYGAYTGMEGDDAKWVPLQRFVVTNRYYEAFSFRAASTYSAFRFAVTGVSGVEYPGEEPLYRPPVRVLIDEVMVFEAVNPSMGFTYVYPFRDDLDKNNVVSNVYDLVTGKPIREAQPLVGENWTVQARIEKRQLPDEIDLKKDKPRVIFHWFAGVRPWGYNNWKNESGAHTAELAVSETDELVYRGGLLKARSAVVDATSKANEVVQYSADVIYRTISGTELTNSLVLNAATEWKRPDWYAPMDYNAQYASYGAASAYTILDRIAPGRVWINEVNLFDGQDEHFNYYAATNQYVEIAAPELQSLEGWKLQYVTYKYETNTLCTFTTSQTGAGYGPVKKDLSGLSPAQLRAYRTNDYVFIAMQSPNTRDAKRWDGVPHAIDGTWRDWDSQGGNLSEFEPVALRLMRPTGVCEEEIALQGTNFYATGKWVDRYGITNWVNELTLAGVDHRLAPVGDEIGTDLDASLNVMTNTGYDIANLDKAWTEWKKGIRQTPGRVNVGQIVPYGFVLMPNGEYMVVRAQIGEKGHAVQSFAESVKTAEEVTLMILKGGEGTNITYDVADWWQVESLTTNGVAYAPAAGKRGRFVFENVGAGCSNDVTVVLNAEPFTELQEEYGLTADNRYAQAVMSWLEGGKTYWGDFKNKSDGKIYLADYTLPVESSFKTNLSLTAMYWLDIDPTVSNQVLKAGVDAPPEPWHPAYDSSLTHVRLSFHMEISNRTTGVAYSPYILRGLEPGSTTVDTPGTWTSVTFKVTGDLQNDVATRTRWVPLRYFTFQPNALAANRSASFDENYRAKIDIWDPKDEKQAVWTKGWSQWPNALIFWSWAIDDRGYPSEVPPLTPVSTFGD